MNEWYIQDDPLIINGMKDNYIIALGTTVRVENKIGSNTDYAAIDFTTAIRTDSERGF